MTALGLRIGIGGTAAHADRPKLVTIVVFCSYSFQGYQRKEKTPMIGTKRQIRILAALGFCCLLMQTPSYAQKAALPEYGQLPDWSGVWQMMGGTVFDRASQTGEGGALAHGVREHPPYNAQWEATYQKNLALKDKDRLPDVITNCGVPVGFPRILNLPDVYEFVVRPEQFWILAENGPNVMRVYTDGRPMLTPEERWGTYTGDSVGHWEGDTLVFQTVSLKGSRDGDSILDRTGLVLSDAATAITRMRKVNETTIEAQLTIQDSKALTKPWQVTKQFRKQPAGTRLWDYGCAENNRNPVNTTTGETLTLGPDGKPLGKR